MDDLCNDLEKLIPLHDPHQEFLTLRHSRSISVEELSESYFLTQTFNRYRRYLMYIDFLSFDPKTGNLILILINEFLSFENVQNYNKLFLAAKCVVIDTFISNLNNACLDSDEDY